MFIQFFLGIFVFLLGLIIGSFLNCVLYRLEQEESIAGRSYCPHCRHTLSWIDLIPLLSFLWLGGKCRYCSQKISFQYPLIEAITGLLFLFVFNFQFHSFQSLNILPVAFLFYIISSLVVIFVFDVKHYLIPDVVLFPAIIITVLYRLFENFSHLANMGNYLLAVLIASGFFLAIFLVSKGKWMGFGDVKFAVLMGLLLGFPNILLGLFLAFFFGAIIGVGALALKQKGLKAEMPFAPFLIVGTGITLFWGNQIISWYMSLFLL